VVSLRKAERVDEVSTFLIERLDEVFEHERLISVLRCRSSVILCQSSCFCRVKKSVFHCTFRDQDTEKNEEKQEFLKKKRNKRACSSTQAKAGFERSFEHSSEEERLEGSLSI
jgi:hypothetical protein